MYLWPYVSAVNERSRGLDFFPTGFEMESYERNRLFEHFIKHICGGHLLSLSLLLIAVNNSPKDHYFNYDGDDVDNIHLDEINDEHND